MDHGTGIVIGGTSVIADNVKIYQGVTLGAVSYTHLRAHETVLDLVCRLLLEKKKNKERTPTT